MREDPGSGGTLNGNLQPMCQQVAVAAGLAVFAVVMDRMVVATGRLEGSEQRLGLGARVDIELLSDLDVLEPGCRTDAMLLRLALTGLGHVISPREADTSTVSTLRKRDRQACEASARDGRVGCRREAKGRCGCANRPACPRPWRPAHRTPSRPRTGSAQAPCPARSGPPGRARDVVCRTPPPRPSPPP